VYLGAHNPLDIVGGAAIGLVIAAAPDMFLDVARDRGRSPLWHTSPAREERLP
jgi:membrane-associated phospholipid phosphatase